MKEFIAYLDSRITEGQSEITALENDGRKDDAKFARIRTNIYDVCRTVCLTLADRPGSGAAAVRAQLERFRAIWGAALEKAKEHGDISAAAVEETKLAALEDVIAHFPEVAGA